jgi:hypothetical protein
MILFSLQLSLQAFLFLLEKKNKPFYFPTIDSFYGKYNL